MGARAMWKGVLDIGGIRIPVKLYSALNDRTVHFRLLHGKDRVPVKQALVNPEDESIVEFGDAMRAWVTDDGRAVLLGKEELESLQPEGDRDIRVVRYVPFGALDHRWYARPYYLGPDGDPGRYAALARALRDGDGEGIALWTMRNTAYVGSLRLSENRPMLVSLRHAGEVVALDDIERPGGAELDKREIGMAEQLIGMLADEFDATAYEDEYRQQVLELIETKKEGGKVTRYRPRKKRPTSDLADALEASLREQRKSA